MLPKPPWKSFSSYLVKIFILHLSFKKAYHTHLVIVREGAHILLLIGPVEASYVPTHDAIHLCKPQLVQYPVFALKYLFVMLGKGLLEGYCLKLLALAVS